MTNTTKRIIRTPAYNTGLYKDAFTPQNQRLYQRLIDPNGVYAKAHGHIFKAMWETLQYAHNLAREQKRNEGLPCNVTVSVHLFRVLSAELARAEWRIKQFGSYKVQVRKLRKAKKVA